ncbi:MAG: S-ribosylhomocysteine lyase [Eubacteriales bacterium SKADARSKE-1]|nr:S-ribosylhomocysteine lyase [Eubacteriales bacterium SKADARSKE-1]
MEKIKSFAVDHTRLKKGMYISRVDDDIITYDLRMVKPNVPPFLENAGLHTFEHLFATYVRNTKYSKNIIYVGPMGCRTGFYFLARNLPDELAIQLVKEALIYISEFNGQIPGQSAKECGNYLDHDLKKAKEYAFDMLEVLENWTSAKLIY